MSLVRLLPDTPKVLKLLQASLTYSLGLANRAQEAHWNVKGEEFGQLHDLFGGFYDFLASSSDMVAERIVQLDGVASANPTGSLLNGDPVVMLSTLQKMAENLGGHYITVVKATSNDPTTNNLVMGILQDLEKWIWKLQASHQGKQSLITALRGK